MLGICPWLDLTMSGASLQRNRSSCFLQKQWLKARGLIEF